MISRLRLANLRPSDGVKGAEGMKLPDAVKLQEYALGGVVVLMLLVGWVLEPDSFLTGNNLRAMLTQASVVGVLAIGMTFVIATAGIDLSVGSVVAAAGVTGGLAVENGNSTVAFVAAAIGFGLLLERSTARPSPTARWSRSSPPWRCWRWAEAWPYA